MIHRLLLVAGCLCVGLGLIGVVVPILPTTPFLLLAAFCFARSSERFHRWLLSSPLFGRYLCSYLEGRGIPLRAKLSAIALLWAGILVSVLFLLNGLATRALLLAVGAAVTLHVATIRPKEVGPEPSRAPAPAVQTQAQRAARTTSSPER